MNHTIHKCLLTAALLVSAQALFAQEIQPRQAFKACPGSAHCAIVTPDDQLLITRGEQCLRGGELVGDNSVRIWELSTGKERALSKLTAHAIALSSDGKLLALAQERSIRLWDLGSNNEAVAFAEHAAAIRAIAFSPDGRFLAAAWARPGPMPGSRVTVVTLHDVAIGKEVKAFESSAGPPTALTFSPGGGILVVATQDFPLIGEATLWDVATGKVYATMPANGVDCLAFSPDNAILAAGCVANYQGGKRETHHVRLWDVRAAKDLHYLRHEFRVYCVAFTADSKTLASGSEGGELKLWDVALGKERGALPGEASYVHSLAFTRDGKTLVSTTGDGMVKCWDAIQALERKTQ